MTSNLKRVLAYFTVSALGMMVLLLGVGSPEAVNACLVFLLAHALYKGALFLVAGAAGTRDLERLGELRQALPITAITASILPSPDALKNQARHGPPVDSDARLHVVAQYPIPTICLRACCPEAASRGKERRRSVFNPRRQKH